MDKRTILAVGAALLSYYVWMMWVNTNDPGPVEDVPAEVTVPADDAPVAAPPPSAEPVVPTLQVAPVELPERELAWSACGIDATVSSEGGTLSNVQLRDQLAPFQTRPLWRWVVDTVTGKAPGPWLPYGPDPGAEVVLSEQARLLEVGAGPGPAPRVSMDVAPDGALTLRGTTPEGLEITRVLRERPGEHCLIDVDVTWRNVGGQAFSGPLWTGVHDLVPKRYSRYKVSARPVAWYDGNFELYKKVYKKLTEPQPREGNASYVGMTSGYFGAVMLTAPGSTGHAVFSPLVVGDQTLYGVDVVWDTTLAPDEAHTESLQLFVGSKIISDLKEIRPELGDIVYLGWLGFFAKILLMLLGFFHGLIGNWGLAIITLTVVVKAAFFPLTQMSFRSSQAMSELQPELKKLKEQLKDKPEELNRRTMELFKEHGVNPLGGCLPMVIQMPVWFSLYTALLNSVDLYHTKFLYLRDLSAADPYMILPVIVVGLMLVQQQFMPTGNMDPNQARIMKMMPLMFGFFFFTFPSGLVLYIFVNMVLTIAQQVFIKRQFRKKPKAAPAGPGVSP